MLFFPPTPSLFPSVPVPGISSFGFFGRPCCHGAVWLLLAPCLFLLFTGTRQTAASCPPPRFPASALQWRLGRASALTSSRPESYAPSLCFFPTTPLSYILRPLFFRGGRQHLIKKENLIHLMLEPVLLGPEGIRLAPTIRAPWKSPRQRGWSAQRRAPVDGSQPHPCASRSRGGFFPVSGATP